MPRYTVQASNGKKLTIEASDEAALHEAMRDYEASGASPKPNSFLGDMASGAGNILASGTGLGGAVEFAKTGKNPYAGGASGVGRFFGDVSSAAGNVGVPAAAIAAGAPVIPTALGALGAIGAGAGANYLMEKTGAAPYLREAGQKQLDVIPQAQSKSVLANFLWEMVRNGAPSGMIANLLEMAPNLAASYVGMKAGMAPMVRPPKAPNAADLLVEHGGSTTPAMEGFAATGKRQGLATGAEAVGRVNPLIAPMLEKMDTKNVKAIQSFTEKKLSPKSPGESGRALGDTFEKFQSRRGKIYTEAREAATKAGDTVRNSGDVASERILKELRDSGIPIDEKGFDISKMTGNESVSQATAASVLELGKSFKNAKSVGDLINQIKNAEETLGPKLYKEYGPASSIPVKQAIRTAKNVVGELLQTVDKNAAQAWRDGNALYAKSQSVVKPALQTIRKESTAPETYFNSIFGKGTSKGSAKLQSLQRTMAPDEFAQIQDAAISSILNDSINPQNNTISLQRLKVGLNRLGENQKFLRQDQSVALNQLVKMMETAGVADLALPNPSGTAGKVGQIGAMTGLGALAFSHPMATAGALLGSGANAAYLKSPSVGRFFGSFFEPVPQAGRVRAGSVIGGAASGNNAYQRALMGR